MKSGYSTIRPNGKPVEPGTLCWIIDLEDGTNPIAVYGKDQDEIMSKLALQNAHAQMALVQRSTPPPAAPAAPAPPKRITPDQVMRATQDLDDPSKSGQAIATLVESATGLDLQKLVLDSFATMAKAWAKENADVFYGHPGNQKLMAIEATRLAGGNLGHVTKDHMDMAFRNLKAQGYLSDPPPAQGDPNNPQPSNSFPDESQVQRTERPRGSHFSTGARSTGFQRVGAPTRTLKYTEEEIRTMPLAKSRRLIDINDQDYADACNFYFGSQATA